jgi:hypothetical protein
MKRPGESELRRGEAATWGTPSAPSRPTMRLLNWKPLVRNSLRGFVDIELPIGLVIYEIPVLTSHGKRWASLPSKPVLDRDGKHVETNGKKQYVPILEWRSRELSDAFSTRIVELVRATHPDAFDGGEGGQ